MFWIVMVSVVTVNSIGRVLMEVMVMAECERDAKLAGEQAAIRKALETGMPVYVKARTAVVAEMGVVAEDMAA